MRLSIDLLRMLNFPQLKWYITWSHFRAATAYRHRHPVCFASWQMELSSASHVYMIVEKSCISRQNQTVTRMKPTQTWICCIHNMLLVSLHTKHAFSFSTWAASNTNSLIHGDILIRLFVLWGLWPIWYGLPFYERQKFSATFSIVIEVKLSLVLFNRFFAFEILLCS